MAKAMYKPPVKAATNKPASQPKFSAPRPVQASPQQTVPAMPATGTIDAPHPAPYPNPYSGVSPMMQGSLPPAASGSDVYSRQFYNGGAGRVRRFLPVSLVP
jgi:hypothetical protein